MSATEIRSHRPGEPYDEAQIELGLTTLALQDGSATRAARQLEEMGTPIPKATLEMWREGARSAQYAEIRDKQAPAIQRQVAALHEDFSRKAMAVADEALDHVKGTLHELPAKEAAGALRNIVPSAGISTDKLMIARERPLVHSKAERPVEEIVAALVALGVVREVEPTQPIVIEATCEPA